MRGDLADRAIAVRLDPIPEHQRRPEREIWADFEAARPRLLGALLDAVAHGLRHLATTQLAQLPRMADFALWAAACEGALWQAGTFVAAYGANRSEMDETVIEGDTVATAVRSMTRQRRGRSRAGCGVRHQTCAASGSLSCSGSGRRKNGRSRS